ncbi:MAG: Eco57I restriction-modification methylase domain-containing protein [Bacteroidales bacterium]|nr:Eco57I restriction-modification methylase domain-containing protein [Bacteroidales bacterium]
MKLYEAKKIITEVFENPFKKEKFSYFIRNLLKNLQAAEFFRSGYNIPRAFRNFIASYERLGKYKDEENNLIDVLIVKLKRNHSIDYARSTQRNFVRWYLNDKGKDAALVAFHTEKSSEWRFSFIKMQYSLEKKKDELTPAKRSSFMVGESGKSHTAQLQLVDLLKNDHAPYLSDIENAFSIEAVSDEFYEKYNSLLFNLKDEIEKIVIKDKTLKEEFESKNISILNFSKKLLGQIVFLYFLQKKGWLGLKENEKYGEGDKNFLSSLFNKTKQGENFFNDYLEYLFYDALSKKRVSDYYDRFKTRIPFLNGGLFDPIKFYNWQKTDIVIPDDIFSNKKGDEEGSGILDVFDLYNFTVKEDEPLETEVAIDPEMLGKVFERMLDVSERKSKGAFYTPREIVHYMAQQSLLYYLETELNQTLSYNILGSNQSEMFGNKYKNGQLDLITKNEACAVPKTDLETFIHYGEHIIDKDIAVAEGKLKETTKNQQIPESIRKNADAIDKALENIKICDPAVGSGAFPVGIMNEIVKLRKLLTPFIIEENANERSAYRFKSNAIQNSIYGVDIDAGAVEIAKLRLWLSMVVDEESINVIEPLPNLEYKIVKGNSLINMPEDTFRNLQLESEIEKLTKNYYTITDKEQKQEQKEIIDGKIKQLLASASEFAGYDIDFDFKLYFHEVWNEKNGFDVVIGNPPYKMIQPHNTDTKIISVFRKLYELNFKIDLFHLFFKIGVDIAARERFVCYIAPSSLLNNVYVETLRRWLLEKTKILEVLNSRKKFFENADVHTTIYLLQKSISLSENSKNIIKTTIHLEKVLFDFKSGFERVLQSDYYESPGKLWNLLLNEKNSKTINHLNTNFSPLENISKINRGLITGNKQKFFSDKKISELYKPILAGKDIEKYFTKKPSAFVLFKRPKTAGGCWDEDMHFAKHKILIRQIGTRPTATFLNKKIAVTGNIFTVMAQNKEVETFITGILNSSLIYFYWSIMFTDFKDIFPQITIKSLSQIPICNHDSLKSKRLSIIVKYILFLKSQPSEKMSFYFEQLIDGMVYELYFEKEIKQAGCDILKYMDNLPEINDEMEDDEKIKIITKVFNKFYNKESPVRKNLYAMEEVEEVGIIKEALK